MKKIVLLCAMFIAVAASAQNKNYQSKDYAYSFSLPATYKLGKDS